MACSINELNRGMGLHDLYPFVIAAEVRNKLAFIHDLFRLVDEQLHPGWFDTLFGQRKIFKPVAPTVPDAKAA